MHFELTIMRVLDLESIRIKLNSIKGELRKNFSVKKIGIFGSYSRGDQGKASDIDILVEFYNEPSFFKFIKLENRLTDALKVKVDLVMKDSLKPNIGRQILNEVIYV